MAPPVSPSLLSGNENSESSCKWSDVYWQTVRDEARWVARRSQADEPISKAQRLWGTDPIQNSRSPRQEINRRQRTGENKLAWANNDLTTCTANANQIKAVDNAQQVRPCWLANQHWGCRSNADKQSDRWQHADTQNEHTDPWTVTVPLPLGAPPGASRGTYLTIVIINKWMIQYVSSRNPTPLLRTVTLPVHQVLKSASPPPRVQNTFYRISKFPIYESRRWGNWGRRINGRMKNWL